MYGKILNKIFDTVTVMIMFKWYRIVVDIKHIHFVNVKVLSKT